MATETKKGRLIVVSGSSGSGKGTVLGELLKLSERFCYSVSATTRAPREGEQDGVNYFFVDRERFLRMVENNQMLEHAEYCGNLYGTPKEFVCSKLEEGINVLLEIEVQGAMQIKEKFPESVLIFITPPDFHSLRKRLYERATESSEVIRKRLETALTEIKAAVNYDYIILNRDNKAHEAARDILAISEGEYKSGIDAEVFIKNFI
jgi:guanylate kinase